MFIIIFLIVPNLEKNQWSTSTWTFNIFILQWNAWAWCYPLKVWLDGVLVLYDRMKYLVARNTVVVLRRIRTNGTLNKSWWYSDADVSRVCDNIIFSDCTMRMHAIYTNKPTLYDILLFVQNAIHTPENNPLVWVLPSFFLGMWLMPSCVGE